MRCDLRRAKQEKTAVEATVTGEEAEIKTTHVNVAWSRTAAQRGKSSEIASKGPTKKEEELNVSVNAREGRHDVCRQLETRQRVILPQRERCL